MVPRAIQKEAEGISRLDEQSLPPRLRVPRAPGRDLGPLPTHQRQRLLPGHPAAGEPSCAGCGPARAELPGAPAGRAFFVFCFAWRPSSPRFFEASIDARDMNILPFATCKAIICQGEDMCTHQMFQKRGFSPLQDASSLGR